MIYPESQQALGAIYSSQQTVFRLWAPASDNILLRLFQGDTWEEFAMQKNGDGTHEIRIAGDWAGHYYQYRLGETLIPDPWGKGASLNARHAAVIDLEKTDPEGFLNHDRPKLDYRNAIIYETHLRDFTTDPEVGFQHPGTFLGFVEEQNLEGQAVGLHYLRDLGITHIHLMPLQDFVSVDEEKGGYNWGYDPELYFVPEGSYVLDKKDPHARLREFKIMVQKIHAQGMGVVMDVVYNHTYRGMDGLYELLAPGYYYRFHGAVMSDGSGCGNELATERFMVRRLIEESLLFFVKECQVDGFRFDLMGLMDIDFTKHLVRRLREVNPDLLIYGEPWTGGASVLPVEKRTLWGSQKGENFALFNDQFRDAIKGRNDDASLGYVQGNILGRNGVLTGITGSIQFSSQIYGEAAYPYESINYHSSHDNLILYDKLKKSCRCSDEQILIYSKMAFAILILSFGLPFFHAGTEFMRSKQGYPNTYNMGDEINSIRWRDLLEWRELSDYVRDLLRLRKRIDAFAYYDADEIRDKLVFVYSHMIIAYTLELGDDEFERLFIAHNPTPEIQEFPFHPKDGILFIHDGKFLEKKYEGEKLKPFSTLVIAIPKKEEI